MFLYKIEATTEENKSIVVVVISESDEKAFSYAETAIRREFLVAPKLTDISLVEKKYLEKGKAYVIENAVV
ncbi:DUF3906 family protein [Brevibacillus dissolubilis]|uniref:DUF3906 family protein n=1 Tax=Brevibacillus dissolubilis TaxID=1844116 RepID=UPI0011179B03|nr:DUF3906 family protein [Brevibacillus dissolubilis]